MTNLAIQTQFKATTAIEFNTPVTMTSQEIAELTNKRHDNVKRTIETLITQGVIQHPQIEEVKNQSGQRVSVYIINKRDSYVIVAQLSPEFTAALVDRWDELEHKQSQFRLPTTFSQALALAAQLEEQREQLSIELTETKQQVSVLAPKAIALDKLSSIDGSITITVASGLLKMRPKDLTQWLKNSGWMVGSGSESYRPSAQHGSYGAKRLILKHTLFNDRASTQCRITYKGLVDIAKAKAIELDDTEALEQAFSNISAEPQKFPC